MSRHSEPFSLALPSTLDGPKPTQTFGAQELSRPVRVLFIVSQSVSTPAISVHANLMRFFDPERVDVHVLYNRLADSEVIRAAGTSVLDILPSLTGSALRATDFGPAGGGSRQQMFSGAARGLVGVLRDNAALVRSLQRERIDVIHCEEGTRNAVYALALSRMTRARFVLHFHARYGPWMSPLARLAVQRADAIVPVSSWAGRLIRDAGVPAQRIFPVLNGIDIGRWDPQLDSGPVRREFGLQDDDPLIVTVAQLAEWKRQMQMIAAFRQVVSRHPRARLLLVGSEINPPQGPGAVTYRERLAREIDAAGLDGQVILTGRRPDVARILAAADVCALPSVGDPCPLAVIEAMAMGKPVVTVADGGTPELVRHDETGLIGPVDDPDALAANLLALIDNPERRAAMGQAARRRALDELNAERMARDLEAVYRKVRRAARPASPVPA